MDQWLKISERLNEWTSPLRPSLEDVEMYKNQLKPNSRTLLLGVTPELQPLVDIAVDNNPHVVELHKNRTILGDWKDLPFQAEFDVVIGDGCLAAFQGSSEIFFQQVKKILKPNGRLILRSFIAPEVKEDLQFVLSQKCFMGFHAFKWRVAHALANPYVAVKDIYEVIRPVWDHPTLNVYQNSDLVYYFPKISELVGWDHIQFANSYELAERCPVITWNFE